MKQRDTIALQVARFIEKHGLIKPGSRVAAAVSGGADSVALLELLLELRERFAIEVSVAHLNHRLRAGESDADQAFVEQLAAARGLRFYTASADVRAETRRRRSNLEATARSLRYAFLESLVRENKVDCVATGHTADDQAETVVARFLRGAGTRGLAGIHPKVLNALVVPTDAAKPASPWLIRPLLEQRRDTLRRWLRVRAAQPADETPLWREDASNADPQFTRNRIRADLLPRLESYNPSIVEGLVRAAEVARDEEAFWDARTAGLLARMSSIEGSSRVRVLKLPLNEFVQLQAAEQRRLVRAAAQAAGFAGQLDAANVEAIRGLAAIRGARRFRAAGLEVVRVFDDLAFLVAIGGAGRPEARLRHQARGTSSIGYEFQVEVPGSCTLPNGTALSFKLVNRRLCDSEYNILEEALLDARRVAGSLTVRNWRPGDVFDSPAGQGTRKIKSLLLSKRVPVIERPEWPVVLYEGRVVWLRGFPVARDFRLGPDGDSGIWVQESREEGVAAHGDA